jgi:hypothetical protein
VTAVRPEAAGFGGPAEPGVGGLAGVPAEPAGGPAGVPAEPAGGPAEPDLARGWFPIDAERHRRDAPRYCPACAAALSLAHGGQGLTTEYWTGTDRVFVCFCGACGWSGDIVLAARVVGHEAAD